MINICKTLHLQCDSCPFSSECDLTFNVFHNKEYWLNKLKEKLEMIQWAIERVEESEDE